MKKTKHKKSLIKRISQRGKARGKLLIGGFVFAMVAMMFLVTQVKNSYTTNVQAADTSFVFTASGDFGTSSNATAVLNTIVPSGSNLHLALGDLSYGGIKPESGWCDYVKNKVGAEFPFQLIAGNHDIDGDPSGQHIDDFATCLPDRTGGAVGEYGKQYYFNYPVAAPLARFIMLSPDMVITGKHYTYDVGSEGHTWVSNAIDDARSQGIKWIIVGMHYPCHTMGNYQCEMTPDLFRLLVDKKVDLVVQGHDHTYQRSKQLVHSSNCPQIAIASFNAGCIADDGADGQYEKGAGLVHLVLGAGGISLYNINTSDSEAGYFAKWMGNNINATYGLGKFTVSDSQISAQFVRGSGGNFTDSFTIVNTAPQPTIDPNATPAPTNTPTPVPTSTPTPEPDVMSPTVTITSPANGASIKKNSTITIRANASDDRGVVKVEFSVNNQLKCADTSASYECSWRLPNTRNVQYTITAKAFDAAGNTATHSVTITGK